MAAHSDGPDAVREGRVRLVALTLLRVSTGFLFFQHGSPKLFGPLPGSPGTDPPVDWLSLLWFSGILETFGGPLLMAGVLTRPLALLLAGEMAVAYFLRHAPRGFWPGDNRGELAALYCFVFLLFAAWGAGRWSVDQWLRDRRRA